MNGQQQVGIQGHYHGANITLDDTLQALTKRDVFRRCDEPMSNDVSHPGALGIVRVEETTRNCMCVDHPPETMDIVVIAKDSTYNLRGIIYFSCKYPLDNGPCHYNVYPVYPRGKLEAEMGVPPIDEDDRIKFKLKPTNVG